MALQEQTIEIEFTAGLETRQDRKRRTGKMPGQLVELENARFERAADGGEGGTIHRRPGSPPLPDGALDGGTVIGALALQAAGDELLRWAAGGVYGRPVDSAGPWVRRGDSDDARPLIYDVAQRVARARSAEAHDCVSVGPLDVIVWTEAQEANAAGGARRVLLSTVLERSTGVQYLDAAELAADVAGVDFWRLQPRLVALAAGAAVVYVTGGKLYARALARTAPGTWGAPVELAADVAHRTELRFPFELDAVAADTSTVRVLYTATSTGSSAVVPVANTGSNPPPEIGLTVSTVYTGTINFRVTESTTISVARTSVVNSSAPSPTVARTSWSFAGTVTLKVEDAPSQSVVRIAGSGSEAAPVFQRSLLLFNGAVDVGISTVPVQQHATNYPTWAEMRPEVAGLINSYGPAGGVVRLEVIGRNAVYIEGPPDEFGDPTWEFDYMAADVKVTGPGGLFEYVLGVREGTGATADSLGLPWQHVRPIGFSFRVPDMLGNGNASSGQAWEFRLRPHVAQYRLNGGAWVATKPDGSAIYPFHAVEGDYHPDYTQWVTVADAFSIYDGTSPLGLTVTLSAAGALGYTTADVWRASFTTGRWSYRENGGATVGPITMYSPTTAAAIWQATALGIDVQWPLVNPTTYTTGDTFTVTVPTGRFVYRLGAGSDSAALNILGADGKPLTHALTSGGISIGVSITWPADIHHPANEEWRATITSVSRLRMLSLQLPGGVPAVTLGPTDLGSPVLEGLAAQAAGAGRVRVVFRNITASAVEVRSYDATHALVAGPLVLAGAPAASAGGLLHVGLLDVGLGQVLAVLEPLAAAPLEVVRFTDTAVTQPVQVLVRGLRLLSRPFMVDGRPMVAAVHLPRYGGALGTEPGVQPTAFILTLDTRRVVARALTGQAGPLISSGLPKVLSAEDGVGVLIPQRLRLALDRVAGKLVDLTPTGLAALELRAADPSGVSALHDGDGLHLGGAAPAYFDGTSWTEDGFHLAPEAVTVRTAGLAAGNLSAGPYSWAFVYEWTDARGRLHRSAPSVPVSATVAAGSRVELDVPVLHLTRKRGVRIVVYRTTVRGSLYYRSVTAVQPEPGEATADTVKIEDATADGDLLDNEAIYSTGASGGALGGELEHLPPPGYSAIHRHQDYLLVNSLDDPYTYAYSLPVADGEGPAWSDLLAVRLPTDTGRVVGFATLDDKLVIFTEGAAYGVLGQGPNKTGGDNGFSTPQKLAGCPGCVDARALITTPDGVLFKSRGGVQLLARTLETVGELGYGVHAWRGLAVTGAVYLPELRESRFYTLEGRTLVYSHAWRQWATFTEQPARGALLIAGAPCWADGTHVRREDPASFDPVPVVVGTGWLVFAPSYANVQRVWRYVLVGTGEASHTVHGEIFYDLRESASGDTATEHFPGPADGGEEVYTLRHGLEQQECNALRFRWTFTPDDGESGAGDIGISLLALEVGVVPGRMGKRLHTQEL